MDSSYPPSAEGRGPPDFDVDGQFRGQRRGFRGTSENAKTKICLRWKAGHCRFGDQCNFAHGEHELRKLPPRSDMYAGPGGRGGPGGPRGGGRGYGGGYGGAYGDVGMGRGGQGFGDFGRGGGYAAAAALGGMDAGGMAGSLMNGGDQFMGRGPGGGGFAPGGGGFGPGGGGGPSGGWTQYFTDEGEPYYHHAATGVTQWEKPPEFGG